VTPSAAVAEAVAGTIIATARIVGNRPLRIHIPVPLHAMSEWGREEQEDICGREEQEDICGREEQEDICGREEQEDICGGKRQIILTERIKLQ